MNPIPVPDEAKAARSDCRLVNMGPPRGVSDDDCGTAEMLIGAATLPGFPGREQYAYFRPTPEELDHLVAGGFLEMCQLGTVVQPFSLAVWPATGIVDDAACAGDAGSDTTPATPARTGGGQSLTTDPTDPRLGHGVDNEPIQQHGTYLVLSQEERAKGFVRPLRRRYLHVDGCGVETSMGLALCETYARQPDFYGSTYCVGCRMHRPVGEFRWAEDGLVVGS